MKTLMFKNQQKITPQIYQLFRNYFISQQTQNPSPLNYIFFSFPSHKLTDQKMMSFKDKKVNREALVELTNQLIYTWTVSALNNQKLEIDRAYFEENRQQLTIYIRCKRTEVQNLRPLHFFELLKDFERILKTISKETTFLPLQKVDSNKLLEEDKFILRFLNNCRLIKEKGKFSLKVKVDKMYEDKEFSIQDKATSNILLFLECLESSNEVMRQKYFLLRIFNDSLYKRIVQSSDLKYLLSIQNNLTRYTSNCKLTDHIIKKYQISQGQTLKSLKASEIHENIKNNIIAKAKNLNKITLTKKDAVFNQNIEILRLIFKNLADIGLGATLNFHEQEGYQLVDSQLLCLRWKYHQKQIYFLITVTSDKQIVVQMQSDMRVFAEQRDTKMHWINMIKCYHINLGARIGTDFITQKKKGKALFPENYVILYASDMYVGTGLFYKIALLIDSLIAAYCILEPGLKQYKLLDTLADSQLEMERKLNFVYQVMSVKYQKEESLREEQN